MQQTSYNGLERYVGRQMPSSAADLSCHISMSSATSFGDQRTAVNGQTPMFHCGPYRESTFLPVGSCGPSVPQRFTADAPCEYGTRTSDVCHRQSSSSAASTYGTSGNRAATIVGSYDMRYPGFDCQSWNSTMFDMNGNLSDIQRNCMYHSPEGYPWSADALNAVVGFWNSPTDNDRWRPSDVNTPVSCSRSAMEPIADGRTSCFQRLIDHTHRAVNMQSEGNETTTADYSLIPRSDTLCRSIVDCSHSTPDEFSRQLRQQSPTVNASSGTASIGHCAPQQQHSRCSVSVAATVTAVSALNAMASTVTSQISATNQPISRRRRKSKDALIPLICRAILSSSGCRLALADICRYICDNSTDYRSSAGNESGGVPFWQSNVRHSLSHYEFFVKDGRLPTGRGNYWTVHPICRQRFEEGDIRIKQARHIVQQHEKSLKKKSV